MELARIHAETAIRNRNQSNYYQTLSGQIQPMIDHLKIELSSNQSPNVSAHQQIIADLTQFQRSGDELPPQIAITEDDINRLIQQLSEDVHMDLARKLPSVMANSVASHSNDSMANNSSTISNEQFELEQRLAKLRRP